MQRFSKGKNRTRSNSRERAFEMDKSSRRLVRIIKRSERESAEAIDSSSDTRTPAQVQREMAAVVISWISDRVTSKVGPPSLPAQG